MQNNWLKFPTDALLQSRDTLKRREARAKARAKAREDAREDVRENARNVAPDVSPDHVLDHAALSQDVNAHADESHDSELNEQVCAGSWGNLRIQR
jgi:hypothetical protein